MTACWTITPLVTGVFTNFETSFFLQLTDPGVKIKAPCISWLLRSDAGHVVVMDTGPHAADAPTAFLHNTLDPNPDYRIDRALQKVGIDPSEVKTVVLSHLHFDHCYNLDLLPDARVLVERIEMQGAIAPIAWETGGYETGVPGHIPAWIKALARIEPVEGDLEVAPGLRMVHLPGHTSGSAGLIAETRQGRYAMAGDNVNMIENWEGRGRRKRIPAANYASLHDYFRSFQKLEQLADRVLASHDFRMFDQAQYG
ncbi:MAG: hypothetical protein NVSMB2_25360 [Chloroflexota bacterium]